MTYDVMIRSLRQARVMYMSVPSVPRYDPGTVSICFSQFTSDLSVSAFPIMKG